MPSLLVGGELLPSHARVEVDRCPPSGWTTSDRGPPAGAEPARGRVVPAPNDLVEGHAELGDDRVQRPDRGPRLPALELGDQARRQPDPARQLALADPRPEALLAQAVADPLEHRPTHPSRASRSHQHPAAVDVEVHAVDGRFSRRKTVASMTSAVVASRPIGVRAMTGRAASPPRTGCRRRCRMDRVEPDRSSSRPALDQRADPAVHCRHGGRPRVRPVLGPAPEHDDGRIAGHPVEQRVDDLGVPHELQRRELTASATV